MSEAKNMVNLLHATECSDCVFMTLTCAHRRNGEYCETNIHDAANLIERIAAELEQVKRERDAAVKDLEVIKLCALCRNDETKDKLPFACTSCGSGKSNWRWRGLCKENGGST